MEKTREVATLKVLGFSSGRIRRILHRQNNWITVIGIVFGLFMGYQLLDGIMQTMTEDQDMPTVIYSLSYLYSIIGTWIVSTGVNTVLSRKVKTICMVDALKGVEQDICHSGVREKFWNNFTKGVYLYYNRRYLNITRGNFVQLSELRVIGRMEE
ncbi:MAG: ABC transporter permease [Lachnospiraceae bacterium]|nr:ABC transporter permease [Lachnospiraceae bacterium]